jgi:pimeloyl-ACP methyl ester carboxylesterase
MTRKVMIVMRRSSVLLAIVGTMFLAALPAASESSSKPVPRSLLLVIDGAGDFNGCSAAFVKTRELYRLPFDIEAFPWSHGHRKIYKDQVDDAYARAKGKELAERILELRKQQTDRPLILVSYSAGSAVGLSAASHLPAETLERHIVLAPSVSTRYDLRPSLRATRLGVDVFCSKKDRWALGIAVRWVGTADELHDKQAAGRYGFSAIIENPGDTELYQKLRNHFWTPDDAKLGHDGRHHGMHAPAFLNKYVVPLVGME